MKSQSSTGGPDWVAAAVARIEREHAQMRRVPQRSSTTGAKILLGAILFVLGVALFR